MFQTTLSPASTKTASLIPARPGLIEAKGGGGGGLAVAGKVASGVAGAASFAAGATRALGISVGEAADAVGDAASDAIDAVGDFFSSILYLPPGRMSAAGTQVSDEASVDELISVSRGRTV